MKMTTKNFLKKIDTGKEFSESELEEVSYMPKGFTMIETIDGAPEGRWTYPNEIYFKVEDRYFYMLRHIGLTELQEEENCCDRPVEMRPPVRKMKTVYFNEWTKKE